MTEIFLAQWTAELGVQAAERQATQCRIPNSSSLMGKSVMRWQGHGHGTRRCRGRVINRPTLLGREQTSKRCEDTNKFFFFEAL